MQYGREMRIGKPAAPLVGMLLETTRLAFTHGLAARNQIAIRSWVSSRWKPDFKISPAIPGLSAIPHGTMFLRIAHAVSRRQARQRHFLQILEH